MSQKFNENLYPDGGWFFRDADGVKHTGSSLRSLINTVRDYRARNGFEAGDPETEIVTQLCGRNPGYCREEAPRVKVQVSKRAGAISTLGAKVTAWIAAMAMAKRFKKLRLVSTAEAKRRAAICARCPAQVAFPLACGACKDSAKVLEKAILDGKNPVHGGIECCSLLGEMTSTSVHLEVSPDDKTELPAHCWRRPQ